ncbi:MAG TPA: hypothetical protein PLV92_04985, partial [Pirellulaceae bacterium]|nr:hypothetical protein [Pirellulaceae bacterium]
GPSITVRGKNGTISNAYPNGSLVNQGVIRADVAGGGLTFSGGGGVTSTGTMQVVDGAVLNMASAFRIGPDASMRNSPGGLMQLSGSLTTETNRPALFKSQGVLVMNGGGNAAAPRWLEVLSGDLGADNSGFDADNFGLGTLNLSNSTYVKLVDAADNSPGASQECLYVSSLIVPAGSTLDLNGLT